jgi:thiol-disulfide isomerase/thioredoxin
MRQILIVLIGTIISLSGNAQETTFHGKIAGIDSAQISVMVLPLKLGEISMSDKIQCLHGQFEYSVNFNLDMWHLVRLNSSTFNDVFGKEKLCSQELKNREIVFFIKPKDKISISGTISEYGINYKVSGNEISNQRSQTAQKLFPIEEAINRLTILKEKAEKNNENEKSKQFDNEINLLNGQISSIELKTIAQHPDWIYSAEILANQPNDTICKYFKYFTNDVQNSIFGLHLSKILTASETGSPAPEFTLQNDKGKNVSINDFKGKYLVVDFWGTWCGACLKGIPRMNEYYLKYKDKIEFISIDCHDVREVWLKAILKYNMNWINLFADDDKVAKEYGIIGHPTKIIIDKEGKIVLKTIGEGDEFYDKLDVMFK